MESNSVLSEKRGNFHNWVNYRLLLSTNLRVSRCAVFNFSAFIFFPNYQF